jgi:aerobic-type carbon monoxide dehydrogenase small subunit (CoxS/CutS family)
MTMADRVSVIVDGRKRTVQSDPSTPLLYVLRDELGLKSPHFGCGLAQCGACTVQLDGKPVKSCVTPLSAVKDQAVTTLAGLGTPARPHPIQAAYLEEQTPQCGYCISGWMMTAAAFLRQNPRPTDAQIRDALKGLKCRCGTHISILRAVKRAAAMMA